MTATTVGSNNQNNGSKSVKIAIFVFVAILAAIVLLPAILQNTALGKKDSNKESGGVVTNSNWTVIEAPLVAEMQTKGVNIRLGEKIGSIAEILVNINMSCQFGGTTQVQADINGKPMTTQDGSWPRYDNPCAPEVLWVWWEQYLPEIQKVLGRDRARSLEIELAKFFPKP